MNETLAGIDVDTTEEHPFVAHQPQRICPLLRRAAFAQEINRPKLHVEGVQFTANGGLVGRAAIGVLKSSGLRWMFAGTPLRSRITWPSDGKYKDASFDHFFVWGIQAARSQVLPIDGPSDHRPAVLTLRIE